MVQTLIVKRVILQGCVAKKYWTLFYRHFFHNVSLWQKVFLGNSASQDDVITQFGH